MRAMWRLVFLGFIVGGVVIVWLTIMQPRRFRQLGKNARTLGYATYSIANVRSCPP